MATFGDMIDMILMIHNAHDDLIDVILIYAKLMVI